MLFQSLLTTAVLAWSLLADNVSANAKFGRFGQYARDSHNIAKRAPVSPRGKHGRSHDGFRFLSNKTKRMLLLPVICFTGSPWE